MTAVLFTAAVMMPSVASAENAYWKTIGSMIDKDLQGKVTELRYMLMLKNICHLQLAEYANDMLNLFSKAYPDKYKEADNSNVRPIIDESQIVGSNLWKNCRSLAALDEDVFRGSAMEDELKRLKIDNSQ
jgi:hypothetical protein